jgi:WD40 repeat protein
VFAGYDKAVHWWNLQVKIAEAKVTNCEVVTQRVYRGHAGPVRALAFHQTTTKPNPLEFVASASDDGTIRLWASQVISDATNAASEFPIHKHDVLAVQLKQQVMATGGKDGCLRIFDAAQLHKISSHLVSGHTKKREDAYALIASYPSTSVIHSLYLTDDATICLVGGGDGWLRVWRRSSPSTSSASTQAPLGYTLVHSQKLHQKAIKQLLMPSPDCLVSLGADNAIKVWRVTAQFPPLQ